MSNVMFCSVIAVPLLAVLGTIGASNAYAASAQVHGQAGVVGDFSSNLPPDSSTSQGWRVPLGLTLEGRASNNLSLFLDLRFGDSNFPRQGRALGNGTNTDENVSQNGSEVRQPFSRKSFTKENNDNVSVGFAFLQYQSEIGLFKVGRMPRHWGLGLWRSADWAPEGGSISTTDSLSMTVDLSSNFSTSLSWDKISEGRMTSMQDDADAVTIEALLADDASDLSSSGISRQIGIAFSNYDHKLTSTQLRVIDVYAKVRSANLGVEGEVYYPSGKTRSTQYEFEGGRSAKCPAPPAGDNSEGNEVQCDSQKIEGFAFLTKLKYQFGAGGDAPNSVNLAQVDSARLRVATISRPESQSMSLWYGYARGDADSFAGTKDDDKDSTISMTAMHPNIRPSLLMNSAFAKYQPGMPGPIVQNQSFVRFDYTFESPSFGMITPALVWGRLNSANTKATATEAVGASKNLGIEFDVKYNYTTQDNITLGLEGGAWAPGTAWQTQSGSKPTTVFGMRTTASTQF